MMAITTSNSTSVKPRLDRETLRITPTLPARNGNDFRLALAAARHQIAIVGGVGRAGNGTTIWTPARLNEWGQFVRNGAGVEKAAAPSAKPCKNRRRPP